MILKESSVLIAEPVQSNVLPELWQICGTEMSVEQVLEEIKKDISFYKDSGGGLTLSGGEPLAQAEFSTAVLMGAKKAGIHTAIETSGFATPPELKMVAEHCDLVLFDIKTLPADYEKFTGKSFRQIEENLHRLSDMSIPIWLRLPSVPGINDTEAHFNSARRIMEKYPGIEKIEIIPYHSLAEGKREQFGCKAFVPNAAYH